MPGLDHQVAGRANRDVHLTAGELGDGCGSHRDHHRIPGRRRLPEELIESVALTGRGATARADEYRDAGVDDLIIVPACTDDDPAGGGLLSELAQTIR